MPANTYVPLLTSATILLGSCGLMTQSAHAETIETDEYIYIGVEAEAFDTGEERWVVTDSATPAIAEDPDGNHSDTSSGGVYLELLPDIRVTHEDAFSPPTAFWGQAGQGPKASYTVTFPEAGRYYVHGRAYSTGTEDNGLHIGLNNDWPLSGRAMQFCTASAKAWTWRSSQRDAGGNGSCGIEKTIYLDIPTAGDHTITISAREDGFELDRFAMIKDKSGNTRICSPLNVNEVTCKNGSIESADGFVDLRLLSTPDTTQASVGDSVNFTATLENLDAFDTATDIEISVSAGAGATLSTADSKCSSTGSNLVCTVAQQAPTASNVNESFEFSMVVSEAGEYVVEASATATETDELPDNNTVSQSLVFDAADTSTELGVEISATATTLNVNDSTVLTVVVNNTGSFTATGANASIALPAGLSVISMPSGCGGLTTILCGLDEIDAQQSSSLVFGLTATAAGSGNAEASITAANDQGVANNSASVAVTVAEAMGGETGGTDTGGDGSTGDTTGKADGSDAGAAELALLLLLLLAVSARLYWLHQRDLVVLRK